MADAKPLVVVWREELLTEEVTLSPKARLVGCVLARFANSNGRSCFPSQRKIADVTGYSIRSVQRAIHELETGGRVVTKMEPIKGGKIQGQAWRTTYVLSLPKEDATVTPSSTEEHASQSPSMQKSTPHSPEEGVTQSPYLEQITKNTYTGDFEKFWSAYPKRKGENPKFAASKKWDATLRRCGVTPSELILTASHYRNEMERAGKIGTPFVMQSQTFLGPNQRWAGYTDDAETNQHHSPYGGRLQ